MLYVILCDVCYCIVLSCKGITSFVVVVVVVVVVDDDNNNNKKSTCIIHTLKTVIHVRHYFFCL